MMQRSDTRVLIVGGGAAGITAAIGLAKRKIPVVVLEGGIFPGAENWSGAVYFCENLAREDILGEDLLAQTPIERRIVRRGVLASDGSLAAGVSVVSPKAFEHCYSVLRPVFDHDLAQKARLFGAEILSGTQALALIRDGSVVRGVLTDRGPIYADVVFLAEGDASNLVAREGLERLPKGDGGLQRPEFLQGIKEVLELPGDVIDRRFGLSSGEGAAFEILLRNPKQRGSEFPLNAGAFLYTNRQSLSLGLVAPLENLKGSAVPHNTLMEWLKSLPALEGLLAEARSVSFGAKVIRGGGYKEIPTLVQDGLAVGGAASGIGVDFPCPNYTGPATFMGATFAAAVADILKSDVGFSQQALTERYLNVVQSSVYWKDVEHLKHWPHYVSKTRHFFGRQVDVATRVVDAGTGRRTLDRPSLSRAVYSALPFSSIKAFRTDLKEASAALGFSEGAGKALLRASWSWTKNLVVGWRPRPAESSAELVTHLWSRDANERHVFGLVPRYLFSKLRPGIAEALHELYRNDGTPLAQKIPLMRRALLHRLHWLDVFLALSYGGFTYTKGALGSRFRRKRPSTEFVLIPDRDVLELTAVSAATDHDSKLAWLTYRSDHHTHIHYHLPYNAKGLPDSQSSSVFQVCPARVYQEEKGSLGAVQVAVLHENCIRCETCWRADDARVDWGRTRGQKLIFEAYTEADAWMRESREAACLKDAGREESESPEDSEYLPMVVLSAEAEREIQERLDRIAQHAHAALQLAEILPSVLTGADQADLRLLTVACVGLVQDLTETLTPHTATPAIATRKDALIDWIARTRGHVETKRFFHAEADLKLLLQHHVADLCGSLGLKLTPPPVAHDATLPRRLALRALLEAELPSEEIARCEQAMEPTERAQAVLARIFQGLLVADGKAALPPGSPPRDVALEELSRVSPGLAVVLAEQLWAIDLLSMPALASEPPEALEQVREDVRLWRVQAGVLRGPLDLMDDGGISGEGHSALLGGVGALLIPSPDGFFLLTPGDLGVDAEITGGIGLSCAGPGTIRLQGAQPRARFFGPPAEGWLRLRAGWDIVAIARGLAELLFERALARATSRVQFPGMFKDQRGRDAIVKFGAVQDMIAEMTQSLEVLRGLKGRVGAGRPAAALALSLLAPGRNSMIYLAGQVLGGTAYSEEDVVGRAFREALALTRMPLSVAAIEEDFGSHVIAGISGEPGHWPSLSYKQVSAAARAAESPLVAEPLTRLHQAITTLDLALAKAPSEEWRAWPRRLGRMALRVVGVRILADRVLKELQSEGDLSVLLPAFQGAADRVTRKVRLLADRVGDGLALAQLGEHFLSSVGEDEAPLALNLTYEDYLKDGRSYKSGDLLLNEASHAPSLLTRELHLSDPSLSELREKTAAIWRERFLEPTFDGLPYPRLLERLHQIPARDVQWLSDNGYFRTVIPQIFGGSGWDKASYYAVCQEMMRKGDPTQAIVVMGSTSIGTTPILLGLKQEIPAERRALEALIRKDGPLTELLHRVERKRSEKATRGVQDPEWAGLIAAAQVATRSKTARFVFGALDQGLRAACELSSGLARQQALDDWTRQVKAGLAEVAMALTSMKSREVAHAFYLQLISAGRISAFALTEPSAGSDTARMRTRATMTSVAAERDDRGFYWFTPEGAADGVRRTLFTYESIRFDADAMRFVDGAGESHRIVWQDYGPDAADESPTGTGRFRYVDHPTGRIPIHDIGRVSADATTYSYPYFRVQGAKMWITNASISGVMVLYARTKRGPTGFMLDSHAEGLTIGKDEHKVGQMGSATNELALNDVRIPLGQIIGIEGRGQENALETLNMGRAGLAVCCVTLIRSVLEDVAVGLRAGQPSREDYAEVGRMVLDLMKVESLAYHLVGLTDHPSAQSYRMESATGKAFASEALHRVLERAERILPPEWALNHHLLEKRRRDARVITIYEGTSEIQRFLLLKDMIEALAIPEMSEPVRGVVGSTEERVTALNRGFLQATQELRKDLGSAAWQQANLQSFAFPLVEQGMESAALLAWNQRIQWLRGAAADEVGLERALFLQSGLDLAAKDGLRRFDSFQEKFRDGRERLRTGGEVHAQVVTDRVILRSERPERDVPTRRMVQRQDTVRVAVFVDPEPILAPRPRVAQGRVREHAYELGEKDRRTLQAALALRASGPVEISVFGTGRLATVDCLEECLAMGADYAWLLDTGTKNLLSPDVAGAMADLVRAREALTELSYDLLLASDARSALAAPLARRLEIPLVSDVARVDFADRVRGEPLLKLSRGRNQRAQDFVGRALVLLAGSTSGRPASFDISGWRRSRGKQVRVIDFVPDEAFEIELSLPHGAVGSTELPAPTGQAWDAPRAAAELLLAAEIRGGGAVTRAYDGEVPAMAMSQFLAGLGAIAVVEVHEGTSVSAEVKSTVEAAFALASRRKGPCGIVVLSAVADADDLRGAAGALIGLAPGARVGLLPWKELASGTYLMRSQLLEGCLKGFGGPAFFASGLRLAALMSGEGRSLDRDRVTLLDGVDRLDLNRDMCVLSGPRREGKLRFQFEAKVEDLACHAIVTSAFSASKVAVDAEHTSEVVLLDEIPLPAAEDVLQGLFRAASKEIGSPLKDAEFIIDVGYGIGNKDGIEEVIEPLRAGLTALGVPAVTVGATRKVTMDLGILPDSAQIGQTGTSVNPKIMICVGVSGAPQHLEYIGSRGVIFAFNKDAEAPLMTLNQRRSRPLVIPVVGDLFKEVPRFLEALKAHAKESEAAS